MYVNHREQINYHSFMTLLRNMRGYSLKKVCKGVCGESGMNRFEKGNRVAEKLVRDRLTSRLGVSCERFEDYLQPKDYSQWEKRMCIIQAIEQRQLQAAREKLEEYESFSDLNCINQQFVEAMRFMILTLEGASTEMCYASIKRAVELTVPNQKLAFEGEHLLADQEVNLILEQVRLETPRDDNKSERLWRIFEYEKIIDYIDNSCWEKLQKVKVYPKSVCYCCAQKLEMELTEHELRHGIKLCDKAIELLRDTGRLYYFLELVEIRTTLAVRLKPFVSSNEMCKIEKMISQNEAWSTVVKSLCDEYQVEAYMSDFCFLYYENECHNIVQVLERRRKMLKLSRESLGDGVCSSKTIIRFEREGVNPSLELVRRLFEKMGICAEYRRSRVISTDVNVLFLSDEVIRSMNYDMYEECETKLNQLRERLCMNIPHNKQEILRLDSMFRWKKQAIGKEELSCRTKLALEYTLPIEALGHKGNLFLSRNEWLLVYDLAFKTEDDMQATSLRLIEEYYESKMNEGQVWDCIYGLELFGIGLSKYLGDVGEYDKSSQISEEVLRASLLNKRSGVLSELLYNKIWNILKQNEVEKNIEQGYILEGLSKCAVLSELVKKYSRQEFYLRYRL